MNAARTISNFGSNVHFQPAGYFEPQDEAEVISILNQCRDQQIRVIGSLHSWSDLVVTDGIVLNVTRLQQIDLQPDGESAWVGAGCQIKTVIAELKRKGRTLPSLGLITEQTIAGATSTGTHGSGRHCLSNYIQAVRVA